MAQKQPPYVGGVGTIAAGGTVFTVTGALDDTNCVEGDHVRDPATGYESRVLERLTVQTFRVPPWRGAALAGAAYELYPDSNLRGGYQSAISTQLMARLTAKGLVWILPPEFANPTAAKWGADPGQYVFSPTYKTWWIMQAGAWVATGAPYGMMAANALSEISSLGLSGTALTNLGGTTLGKGLFTAGNEAAARSMIQLDKQSSLSDATAGRVMTAGSFGLGGTAISLLSSDSAIADRPTGFYYCNGSSNTPIVDNGWLTVISITPTYRILEFVGSSGGARYIGEVLNGTFSGWRKLEGASGSNAVGRWTRLASGLLMTTQTVVYNSTSWSTAGWGAYCNLPDQSLPANFTTPLSGVVQVKDGAVSARAAYSTYFSVTASQVTSIYVASPSTAPGTTGITLDIRVVGVA